MTKISVAGLIVGLTAVLVVSAACGSSAQKPAASRVQIPTLAPVVTVAPRKWEYKLETIQFDKECATQALSPYQTEELVKLMTENHGFSHDAIGSIWQIESCGVGELPTGVLDKIISSYIDCGQQAFAPYAGTMGDDGWEMVSYIHLQHTTPGSQYCSSVVTDYGYEVMWKRPKGGN